MAKILIVSDTHGKHENLRKVLRRVKPVDMLIHCGDVEDGEETIKDLAGCPVHMVAGNNDYFSDLPREEEFTIGKYNVLLTHGHYYYITMGTDMLKHDAYARGFNLVMFGHTHRPYLEQTKEITILNPGSISYPRQEGRRPSYIIMDIDRKGDAHYTVNYLA